MSRQITVTAEDIAAANEWRAERNARIAAEGLRSVAHSGDLAQNCPVARAVRRGELPGELDFVGATTIFVTDEGRSRSYTMAREAQVRINDWDMERGMEPFAFAVVEDPDERREW